MPARDSFWASLLERGDGLGVDAWTLALMATVAATVSAVVVINLKRRFRTMTERLASVESAMEKRAAEPGAPSLNVFCQQLMNALGMELPGAVSARMSADDPARFIRALTIYTRAQRRRLIALYRQAESLREALNPEDEPPVGTGRIDDPTIDSFAQPEIDPPKERFTVQKRSPSRDLELVR